MEEHKPKLTVMDGVEYAEALKHALKACPKGKSRKKGGTAGQLSHILFFHGIVGGSDGHKLHKAVLPPHSGMIGDPIAVTRESARVLLIHLNWAISICASENTVFGVRQNGLDVWLYSGEREMLKAKLVQADVGRLPSSWPDPVDGTLTVIQDGLIDLNDWKASVNGRTSWGKIRVAARFRGFGGPRSMLRVDLVEETATAPTNARAVAYVFMLPKGAPPAPLPPKQGELGHKLEEGHSIASLNWAAVAEVAPPAPAKAPAPDKDDEDDDGSDMVTLSDAMTIKDIGPCLISEGGCGAKAGESCTKDGTGMGAVIHTCRVMNEAKGDEDEAPAPAKEQPKKGGRGRGKASKAH